MAQFIGAVHSQIFMSNDVLVKAGARGDALYFIAYGTMVVYNSAEKEVKDLLGIRLGFVLTLSAIAAYDFALKS